MSVPQSSGADDTMIANPVSLPEQTLIEPNDAAQGTIVEPFPQDDRDATITEKSPSQNPPEAACQTVIDAAAPNTGETLPEIQATAGSSSAGRGWAPTKGATGNAWPQALPTSATQPTTPKRSLNGPRAEDRYRLLDNFAHGGLGNIWRAKDTSIHREIAFKELLPKALRNPVVVERFLEEAQITGQLEHPGIVPIYDVGFQENGTPFYAMKLLKGGNMEAAIEAMHAMPRGSTERQLAFTRLLRQFIAVCQAVGFAHDKGVLHRDLKPLNIMIGEFGETLVLDWGLAKVLDVLGEQVIATDSGGQLDHVDPNVSVVDETLAESPSMNTDVASTKDGATGPAMTNSGATGASATSGGGTQSSRTEAGTFFRRQVTTDARTAGSQTMMGQVMGTPAYMPPEQAQGTIDTLDARTDIYSLGAILYRLLTNKPPVARGKAHDVLVMVIAGQITPPREIDPTIPAALEAICRKAMARQQVDRYPKALDLAADVEAWLADEPVSTYPDRWQTRLRRWYKRHQSLVHGAGVAAVVLVTVAGAWIGIESNRIEKLRLAATSKRQAASIAIAQADFGQATSLLNEALGQVQAETKLAALRNYIRMDLNRVANRQGEANLKRISDLSSKAARLLDDARKTTPTTPGFAQARTLLTEAVTLLAKEASLAEQHRQAQSQLSAIDDLAEFTATVEQVRVLGSNLSGQDSIDDFLGANRAGQAGLEMFAIDFDQPEKLDPRLALLGPEAIETWRDGMFELLFTVAQAQINLAVKDEPAKVRAAARWSLDELQNADRLGRTSPAVAALKADLFDLLGKTDEAQAALKEMTTIPARTRFDHYFLGELSRQRHDYDTALSHYQDALQVDPDDYWSLNMIGYCHLYSQRLSAATAAYTACIARRPDVFWPYVVRGYAFGELQQFEHSQRDFDKALELAPNSYFVFLNRGVVFLKKKDYAAARADFVKAAELRPDLSAPHENLADLSRLRGRELATSDAPDGVVRAATEFQTSLVELTKALPMSPQQATLYHARGMIRVALADPTAALDDFQRAIRLSSNPLVRAAGFREIGFVHQRAKRLPEALAAFDQSLKQNPRDTNVIRQRAEVLLSLGQFDDAIAGFTKFLELEGPVGDVYRARGSAFAKTNKYREAINDYTMSLQYEPAPNMLKQRGKAYLLQATQLAKEDFEESLRLNPIDPDARWGLAHAMVMLGDHAGGVAELEKAAAITKRAATQFGPPAWPLFFNPATTYAQALTKLLSDLKLSPERREELAKQYTTRAVELLADAHRLAGTKFHKGFVEALHADESLNPIRQQPAFREALQAFETEPVSKSSKP